ALEHAAAAEDWPLLGEVFVEGAAAELAGPHRETVAQVLRRVPYATLRPDARLHLCAGALASVDERFDAVRLHVARARDLLAPAADLVADPAAAVLLELLAASVARSSSRRRRRSPTNVASAPRRSPVPAPARPRGRGEAVERHRAPARGGEAREELALARSAGVDVRAVAQHADRPEHLDAQLHHPAILAAPGH
ncbi:hypothetical protein IU11_05595, partial [Cellulosimicrobium sp. MM]